MSEDADSKPKRGGGRPSTALSQDQLCRYHALDLTLKYGRGLGDNMSSAMKTANQVADFIKDGHIPHR